MKLSEIRGDHAIEVIADLIEPIANIATDEKCAGMFKIVPKKGEDPKKAAARQLVEKVPVMLKTHKRDVVKIIATIDGKSVEEMNLFNIAFALINLVQDEALIELFTSAAQSVEQSPPTDTSEKPQE